MSAQQSNLSNDHYGYDFVVATTQASINAAMKEYLYNTIFQTVKMYWNQDDAGNPVVVSYKDLMKQTNNTDPLEVAEWKTGMPMTKDITNINNSNFYFAFEAAIGIPANMLPKNIPDIVTLQRASQTVIFNLLCANFTIVTCNFGRHGLTSFEVASQPDDKSWMFTSTVALKSIIDNTNLPAAVQTQLDNFGASAFSVQQLIFDFDNANLESVPTISGVQAGTPAYTLISQVFLGAYFSEIKKTSQPVLNYSIVKNSPTPDPSTLVLTDMGLLACSYKDPKSKENDYPKLNTLNYLCATNGNSLPPATPFGWNWVEKADEANTDGVIAINRNTFANYFKDQLTGYISKNCFACNVRVWLKRAIPQYDFGFTGGQTPTVTMPTSGAEVLTYAYSSSAKDQAGVGGDMGRMALSSSFNASVSFVGNTIVIAQTLKITIDVRRLANSESWNSVDKTITDTYTLAIDKSGSLTASLGNAVTDHSQAPPKANWFINLFTNLNKLDAQVDTLTKNFAQTSFKSIPVNVAQQFIFPGGKTFVFKDVNFSDFQDLVSNITYAQS